MGNEYLGQGAYVIFGSQVLTGRYTSINLEESADMVDKSAGADTHKSFLDALHQGTFTMGFNLESDSTVEWASVALGTEGTFDYAPEGTGSGEPKYSAVCIVSARDRATANADLERANVTFTRQIALTESTYV